MDNYSLKLFVDLSETRHFGKTSQNCNISPSALSRQVQRMEDAVGHKLFDRDNRNVKLTSAGFLFKVYAEEVLEKWQSFMEALIAEGDTPKGEISLYCSVTASLSILPSILESFRCAYPEIHINLKTGDAASAIRKVIHGEIDIAVAAMPDSLPKKLSFKTITITPLVFIAPKIIWEFSDSLKNDIPWDKIPMVISEWGLARKRINSWFKNKGVQPNIYAKVSGNEAIISMVSLGCGVGIVPKLVVEKSLLRSNVKILNVKPDLDPYHVGICVQKRKMKSSLIRAFWDLDSANQRPPAELVV